MRAVQMHDLPALQKEKGKYSRGMVIEGSVRNEALATCNLSKYSACLVQH